MIRTSMYQSGLPYAFWSEAAPLAVENMNRTADMDNTSPHEKRFGVPSTMTLAPFGAGVRYLIEERPRGRKLAPRSAPGLVVGYSTAKSLKVLDLQEYVTSQKIKFITTRDYRFVPSDTSPFSFPFVKVASLLTPSLDWSFSIDALPAAQDARGPVALCPLCGRPVTDEEDLADPCPACDAEAGVRRRVRAKSSDKVHVEGPRCLKVRCRCGDKLDELLPVVEFAAQEAADDDVLPEGFIDFSHMDMDRVEAPSFGMVTRVVAPTSREAQSSLEA